MRKIAVVNMKGGVGKTTTALHVAAGMAARGERTLLIDVDPQGNIAHVLGVHAAATVRELMTDEAAPEAVIVDGVRPNLSVIISTPSAFSLDAQLAGAVQRETLLSRRLAGIHQFDAVVVDTSPAMGLLTYNGLLYANEIVVPVAMDSLAFIGARQTLDGVREVRALWPDRPLTLGAVVPTNVNQQTLAARAALSALESDDEMKGRLFRQGIRRCLDLTYAAAARQTIWEYAPDSRAAEDYSALLTFLDGTAKRH